MKKNIVSLAFAAAFALVGTEIHAQSWKDILNTSGLSKVVSTITGESEKVDMVGTWNYQGSAVEFKSENLLMKAGGAAAASMAESKLNEQLTKVGIRKGQMSFTFNADSTFTSKIGKKKLSGVYSYNPSTKLVNLKFQQIVNMQAKVNSGAQSLELLFNSDKLLRLLTFIGSKSTNTTLKTISSLADQYDGMLLGFDMGK